MSELAESVLALRSWLGPELWLLAVAFVVGGVVRLTKRLLPAEQIPIAATIAGAAVMGSVAVLLGEPLLPAIVLGVAAGATPVGGHELAKKVLEAKYGTALAEKLLGVSADKADPSGEEDPL
jgi:CHASE2 domain-containing sensor protein